MLLHPGRLLGPLKAFLIAILGPRADTTGTTADSTTLRADRY